MWIHWEDGVAIDVLSVGYYEKYGKSTLMNGLMSLWADVPSATMHASRLRTVEAKNEEVKITTS
jgi:hypothetical protein